MTQKSINRFLFLDVDGVLNSVQNHHRLLHAHKDYDYEKWKEDHRFWDPNCVSNLRYLLDLDENLKVILHSWWRNFPGRGTDHVRKCFDEVGLPGARIADDTSHFMDKPSGIKDYILRNIVKASVTCTPQGVPVFPDDIRVLIFDDVDMGLPGLQILTDDITGLTLKDVRLACQMLHIVDHKPSLRLH